MTMKRPCLIVNCCCLLLLSFEMKLLWVSANCGEQEAVVLVQRGEDDNNNNNNNNEPLLLLRQWQTTVPPPSSQGAIWWDMELVYAGRGWLGLGFNANGKMVGSTVVVGMPPDANDEMDESITAPAGIYYLGERNPLDILPLSEATDSTETKQGSPFVSNATATPSMSPSAATTTTTTSHLTTKPDTRIPTMVPTTVASTTNNPTVVPTYPPSISLPKDDSTLNPTMVDTQSRTTVPTNNPSSSPTTLSTLDAMVVPIPTTVPTNKPGISRLSAKPTDEPGVWRRQLLPVPRRRDNYHGLQEIAPGAIIVQNDTHTILRARRLHLHDSSLLGSSSGSSSNQENGDRLVMDTLIFAVGASNSFAFHKYYGSRPLQSSPCPLEEYDSPSEPFRPSGTFTLTEGIVGVCMTMMMMTVFAALF